MKKILTTLLVVASIFSATFATDYVFDIALSKEGANQTIAYNQYGPNYQATPSFTHLVKGLKPVAGDTVTVHFKGTSDIDLSYLRADLVDNSAQANYWTVLAEEQSPVIAENIKAGATFENTITYHVVNDMKGALVISIGYDDNGNDYAKVGKAAKISFEKIAGLTTSDYGTVAKQRKPKKFNIDISKIMKMIDVQPSFQDGNLVFYQSVFAFTEFFGNDLPIKGDTLTLTYKGTSTIDIPEIQITLVENTAAVGWWRDLVSTSNEEKWFTWATDIKAGKVFKAKTTIPVNVAVEEGISIQLIYYPFEGSNAAIIKFAK